MCLCSCLLPQILFVICYMEIGIQRVSYFLIGSVQIICRGWVIFTDQIHILSVVFFSRRQEKELRGIWRSISLVFSRGDKTSRGFSGREEGLAAWGTADFLFWKGRARNGNLYYLWVGHCGRQYSARALCSQAHCYLSSTQILCFFMVTSTVVCVDGFYDCKILLWILCCYYL